MLGAIAGDMIGSVFEFRPLAVDWRDFRLFSQRSCFTDDTVMTLAVAKGLVLGDNDGERSGEEIIDCMHELGRQYPRAGYGGKFMGWLAGKSRQPYNSFGNGSAMRVSSVGWSFDTLEDVEKFAAISAEVSHNHPEGIKGACAVAGAIFLARHNHSKEEIKRYVISHYGYNLDQTIEEIRLDYDFDETCQGSVPQAIIAFLESENFEEAVRKAVYLRGDADTQADIAGAIAEPFYGGVPEHIKEEVLKRLDPGLREIIDFWRAWLETKGLSYY